MDQGEWLEIEHDYQKKVMFQRLSPGTRIDSMPQLLAWKAKWMKELAGWHAPYKVLLEGRGGTLRLDPKLLVQWERMLNFFRAAHMREMLVVDLQIEQEPGTVASAESLWTVAASLEAARERLGLAKMRQVQEPIDFRGMLQFENHFRQQVIELIPSGPVQFDSPLKLNLLRAKITNLLMQWHSPWNLLIDCTQCDISPELLPDFERHLNFLKGVFLKSVIGYGAKATERSWPFPVYRARHKAVALLEGEGNIDAAVAQCASRTPRTP
jgi:hypothetical protein